MLNPKDIENIDTVEGRQQFAPEMLAEFENGKGEDEDDEQVQQQPVGNVRPVES